jgi:hypothetical protein
MRISVIYLKSILAGVAAFVTTVIVFTLMAVAVMQRFPEVAQRVFSGSYHTLGWGGYFDLPPLQIVIVGLLAFVIAFGWMLRRASATT